jgi:DNA-binding CsgD family transcriptional regulator
VWTAYRRCSPGQPDAEAGDQAVKDGDWPAGGLDVAVEIGRIASTPGTAEQRAAALWEPLRRLVPFQAACIILWGEAGSERPRLISVGYGEPVRKYIFSSESRQEIELIGYNKVRRAMRVGDMPVPPEQVRSWVEYLKPAGFRDGLGVGLFSQDGRHLGVLGLNTDHVGHPTEAARDLIGMLAPVIANAVDPLRSTIETARMVRDAVGGAVLTSAGETMPLPGLPAHPILAPISRARAAAERLARENAYGSFLCPVPDVDGADGHLRVTVLACPGGIPGRWAAAAVVSPPGDVRGLTHREMQITGLLIEGWPNPRIAAALFIAERTVATHLEHILSKLDAPSRTLAASRALRSGAYIPPSVTFPDDGGSPCLAGP